MISAANSWMKVTAKHCEDNKHTNAYDTIESAKKACIALRDQCMGVYDDRCDGVGLHSLCKPGSFVSSSIGSCVYLPPGSSALHENDDNYMYMCVCIYASMYG